MNRRKEPLIQVRIRIQVLKVLDTSANAHQKLASLAVIHAWLLECSTQACFERHVNVYALKQH